MVVLEAAAIGAAGYGLYRGGDAAVRKGKESHKNFQRERARNSQRSELNAKSKERQGRIAQLAHLRSGNQNAESSSSLPNNNTSWPSFRRNQNSTAAAPPPTSVNERHESVMAKLRQKPNGMEKQSRGKRLSNMFKRK